MLTTSIAPRSHHFVDAEKQLQTEVVGVFIPVSKSVTTAFIPAPYPLEKRGVSLQWKSPCEVFPTPPAYTCVISSSSTATLFNVPTHHGGALSIAISSSSKENSESSIRTALNGIYDLDAQGQNRTAARELLVFIEEKLQKRNLSVANNLLAKVDVNHLSSRSMIGLIRSTYRVRKDLPAWNVTFEKSWHQVEKLGKSPKSLFIGLPSPLTRDEAKGAK